MKFLKTYEIYGSPYISSYSQSNFDIEKNDNVEKILKDLKIHYIKSLTNELIYYKFKYKDYKITIITQNNNTYEIVVSGDQSYTKLFVNENKLKHKILLIFKNIDKKN